MMGNVEIKMTLRGGQRPNLKQAGSLFGQAADKMGIRANEGNAEAAGSSLRIRVDGVAGITDVDTPIKASFLPGSLNRAGMLNIQVAQHPTGRPEHQSWRPASLIASLPHSEWTFVILVAG